ncbi:MAG: SIS domain-containing protein [Candidatus Baltobacteraceae bacterium]
MARRAAERFEQGGRILAFGRGPYATDAQHTAVEFVHPVLVGKRALPALDISLAFKIWVRALARPQDIAIGYGPPGGDPEVSEMLAFARARGALTIGLPDEGSEYAFAPATGDERLHQELVEIACHVLYESVHVFLEHGVRGRDLGDSSFLYPFLADVGADYQRLTGDATHSILAKERDGAALREALAEHEAESIAATILALGERLAAGGTLFAFGNGGSATDATDFALDCATPAGAAPALRAVSLALEPALITALLNDVGREVVFLRQIIAQAGPADVVVAFSTSGGSSNVIAALAEARQRGLLTVAILGYDGGEILRKGLADRTIVVRSDYIPRIQEAQAAVYHTIREGLARLHGLGA